jgi:hypothetical protein
MKPRYLIPSILLFTSPALAQEKGQRTVEEVREVRTFGIAGDGDNVRFAWSSEAFEGKQPVKNAPYSATAVTELEQTLGDGNRIKQTTKSLLARDREGRTRKELTLGAVGPLAAGGDGNMIFLQDPVSGGGYTLDPEHKVARKLPKPDVVMPRRIARAKPLDGKPIERVEQDETLFNLPAPPPSAPGPLPMLQPLGALRLSAKKLPPPKTEDLGTQVIEGVRAQGTRTTSTIPAGAIGNERPIVSTSERWFSPDLGIVVMSKSSDPRLGTTTYRVTDLVRSEPDPSLFQVPADYTTKEEPGRAIILRRRVEKGP